MILDPTTAIGKLRLRLGDYSDFPIFEDPVYQSALDDNDSNLNRTTMLMAQYILATLTQQTHQKLVQIEVYGGEWFTNYLAFIKATILNPSFMSYSPFPYSPSITDECGNPIDLPLIEFQKDWNKNYINGTQSQEMHCTAKYICQPFCC